MVPTGCVPQTQNPEYPILDTARTGTVADYLLLRNILQPQETISRTEPPEAGVRNSTIRVVTSARSLILKQFREWPANGRIAPPAEVRFRSECQFHRSARIADCVGRALPEMLHHDASSSCILYEDVAAPAASSPAVRLSVANAESLAWFLVSLHHHSQSVPAAARYRNEALVQWHFRRLFGEFGGGPQYAWRRRVAASGGSAQSAIAVAAAALEQPGSSLVHGDFTPGNWLIASKGNHVVDAEFSFFGCPEFDVGALLAGLSITRQSEAVVAAAIAVIAGGCYRYDERLAAGFAAAHLGAMLDERTDKTTALRGAAASAAVRRALGAAEAGTLQALIPAR